MDPSSYGHHHHHHHHHHGNHPRYVPLPPPPPPPPLHHPLPPYQQSPTNLYPSRHHLPPPQPPQLPPPQPPPPPPLQHQQQLQQPYHPLPAPPPPLPRQQLPNHHAYDPPLPQYTYSPNFNSNPNPSNVSLQFHDSPQRRVPEFDPRPDYWPDNRVSRPHPVSPPPISNLEREVHYHQFDRRPASPGIDRFRHELEESSRIRALELNQREREELDRVHTDRWVSDRSSRDFGIVSMGFESNSNNSGFDHEVSETVRWGSHLHDQLIDNGNNDIQERDEMRGFTRKMDYLHDSEVEMFSDRASSREDSHEFNRTPRKQIQKKSALLRIQKAKPTHRSREDEKSHYSGEGKPGNSRGKDLVLHSDQAKEEKEREGSPVELDVSFKSNSLVAKVTQTTPSTNITKPRTWHRTNNSSASPSPSSGNKPSLSANPSQKQTPKKAASSQGTSYIRKGNSLVRKPVSVPAPPQGSRSLRSTVYRLNSGVVDEVKKGTRPNSRADSVDLKRGGGSTTFERPTTPPLPSVTKISNRTPNSSGECTETSLPEPSITDCCETTKNRASSMEITDVPNSSEDVLKTSETLNGDGSANNSEDCIEQNESNLAPSNAKSVTYVKPKSNQLVATSDHGCASTLNADKNQTFSASSDGYYKKSKNQLIRTALESNSNQTVTISGSNSAGQVADKLITSRTLVKRRSNKVVVKTHKPSKFSLVWTLRSARLSHNDANSPHRPKVLPHLFPWKRTTYCRSFKLNSVSSCSSSLSTIGWKMLLLRKRNTVYTRSINGFSIRKSKVLSVGGSSLKWSKSIESHSRKANEEATLAVAEAERKKRERNGTVSATGKRSYSCHKVVHDTELRPGERIFRIGSVRYKMDSSRRSLQRISDDESSCSAVHQSGSSSKKSYVPRRLVIGNDEYVRIGNGNQLVRNPKKRTRVLASEKVRWSLHTARLRLVKKRKYCQFFTRFGKCNKDDGKCPYIHDPSKIAVCTKFLKGLCTNSNCKLTHKVIPERMPDCSYFLQGLCTNENCPYRHVHVTPNASTCEGFLRGYCADGNECRKKHSYVCPNLEATGSCPQGSKCKLHHPKMQSKGKKRKRSMEYKNARGRYFGIDILEPKKLRHQAVDDDDRFFGGEFSDYIHLDVSDDEAGEICRLMNDEIAFGDNDSSELQLDDLDELIKPIRIMSR
ncbi:Zinc finger, CCCH-type [Corchorus capsularis]|uniref:Zinc finger, CCCH-type n=1 Tax=Corchorus capsularis TaxID=210143 RepID=A0A1R3J8R7_COCAP|nr:Zinc finger, CCCH-type [Corchorus capsularis]